MKENIILSYKYDELPKEVQEKVLENYRDINTDTDSWYYYLLEDEKEKLANIGFLDAEINFSGFWSQGDGASFTTKNIDLQKLATYLYGDDKKFVKKVLDAIDKGDCTAYIERLTSHYYHYNTCDFILNINNDDIADDLREALNQLENEAEDLREQLSKEIFVRLRAQFEYLNEDAQVIETIKANDYDFTIDGKIF